MMESAKLTILKSRLQDIVGLGETLALLDWDMQTNMPVGGAEDRARQISTVSKLTHQMFTADETGTLLQSAAQEIPLTDYDSDDVSLLRVTQRDYDRSRKLPNDLVAEIAHQTAIAHEIWAEARAQNNFKSFIPALERILELKKRVIECRGYTDHPYDALLDDYEPGLKTADVNAMFAELRKELVPLVHAISKRVNSVTDAVLHQDFDEDKQRDFAEMVAKDFGYDFSRGREDRSVHPFCTSFSSNDVRITTRYDSNWLNPALFGILHEAGHAMYEQGINNAYNGTMLIGGTSLGVHESQSRLWENLIGRSRGFWKHYFPKLQTYFPSQLGHVDLETFYRAINRVEPSFIRVEADEVTYNLHIMLRFELEKELVEGKLKVTDLPDAWNARSKEYLGIVPPTDTLGVLQDVHWSGGSIGYFPTYSMGTLLSAQLLNKAIEAHPSIPAEIEQGKFATLLGWLRQNIHQYGRKYEPKELIMRAIGEPLNAAAYVRYLKAKFGEIYELN